MTDRLKGCFVAFDHDIREDDAQELIKAIKMLKCVAEVTTSIATPDDWMNREQVKVSVRKKLWEFFEDF